MADDDIELDRLLADTKACFDLSACREFTVERNRDLIEDVLDKAYDLVQMVEADEEPPCSIKPGGTCVKCKEFAA